MEAHRRVEFTSIELASGAELTAPVEKAATGPVEKAAAGLRAGEAHGKRGAQWRGRKMGCHALARRGCRPAEWRHNGEGGAMERRHGGVRSQRAVAPLGGEVSFFFFFFKTIGGKWMSR
jgi:hypothetical protein